MGGGRGVGYMACGGAPSGGGRGIGGGWELQGVGAEISAPSKNFLLELSKDGGPPDAVKGSR